MFSKFKRSLDWPFNVSGRGKISDPFGDYDKDGVPNMNDCAPKNPKKQDGAFISKSTPLASSSRVVSSSIAATPKGMTYTTPTPPTPQNTESTMHPDVFGTKTSPTTRAFTVVKKEKISGMSKAIQSESKSLVVEKEKFGRSFKSGLPGRGFEPINTYPQYRYGMNAGEWLNEYRRRNPNDPTTNAVLESIYKRRRNEFFDKYSDI